MNKGNLCFLSFRENPERGREDVAEGFSGTRATSAFFSPFPPFKTVNMPLLLHFLTTVDASSFIQQTVTEPTLCTRHHTTCVPKRSPSTNETRPQAIQYFCSLLHCHGQRTVTFFPLYFTWIESSGRDCGEGCITILNYTFTV